MNTAEQGIRVDKWLWAARFYKTRQLAIKALKSSQISANKNILKASSLVRVGDVVLIKKGHDERSIEVLGISDKRGPAKVAQLLYQETPASIARREKLKQQMALQPRIDIEQRKPDRRKIRDSRLFKRGE